MNAKAEAEQLYIEAAGYVYIDEDSGETRDDSQDWKIRPMDVLDPDDRAQWNKDRLWMLDPMDGIFGDDNLPANCAACNGVFWGDEMVSVRDTIDRLRRKHNQMLPGMMGNPWEESEGAIVDKLRKNRVCYKCFKVQIESRANPHNYQTTDYGASIQIPQQQILPFSNISSTFPPLNSNSPYITTCSGMAPPPGGWSVSLTDDDL